METQEKGIRVRSGWGMLALLLTAALGILVWMAAALGMGNVPMVILGVFVIVTWVILVAGFYTLQPNEAAVLILFGDYRGTDKAFGFKWANPFFSKHKVSLRARNLNGEVIKVNDSRGNPIEIAAVIVWQVIDTAHAVFDVDDFVHFVNVQSESALRHLAMAYPYDCFDGDVLSLRGSTDEVSKGLQTEVQERVTTAGVHIIEARLSHLAYASEIAGAMLQRQQAEAIVAARSRIVDGAVGMVEMALDKLEQGGKLTLDDERKAAMISNLMVVLCGHADVTPVVNTGSLYS